jgi:hypothetical protein
VSRRSYLHLEPGWVVEEVKGLGPFVTRQILRRPDGKRFVWESRGQRKRATPSETSTWWAPHALGWWIGALFAVGSFCFALGALPLYSDAVGGGADNVTYFVGSLFFTTAAFLQYCQVVWADPQTNAGARWRSVRQLLHVRHDRIDWWAALVQLVGTLFFNVTTYHAMDATITSPSTANRLVWRPDALGSICFLIASWLAWAEVSHGWASWRPRSLSWWVAILNLVGSVAFGASAVASKVQPSGDLRSLALTNLGTFVGALCFLAGGLLLLPERTEEATATLQGDPGARVVLTPLPAAHAAA